jgi:hypothetical protein
MSENSKSLEHPQTWRWDEDGNTIDGGYVRMESANSEYGPRAIIILAVAGAPNAERSLWLNETALQGKFRDELANRAASDFRIGERITVTKGTAKVEGGNGRSYWPFTVVFHDAPKRSASELLGVTTSSTPDAEPELPAGDDPLPF